MMGIGAFAVLYGPATAGAFRLRLAAATASGLALSAALGVATHSIAWLNLLAMAVVAVVAASLCLALKVGPPGAYFFVLVCGVAGYMAQHGQPPLTIVGLTAAGGMVAVATSMLDLLWSPHGPERRAIEAARRALESFEKSDDGEARALASQSLHHAWTTLRDGRGPAQFLEDLADLQRRYEQRSAALASGLGFEVHPWGSPEGEEADDDSALTGVDTEQLRDSSLGRPGPQYLLRRALSWPSETLLVAQRVGVAALLCGVIALLTPMAHPYWTVAFAVLVLHQGGPRGAQTVRGIQRLLGTVVGLGIYWALALWAPHGLVLAGLLFGLQFAIELLVVRNYALAVAFITPLALTIASASGSKEPLDQVIAERFVDSVVGVGVALAVLWFVGRGLSLLLARSHGRRAVVAMDPVLAALTQGSVGTSAAAEQRRRLYFELLELQQGLDVAIANEPRRVGPYRVALARVAHLGYAILGACWGPQDESLAAAAREARHRLGAITAHPVSGHRQPFDIDDDVSAALSAITRGNS